MVHVFYYFNGLNGTVGDLMCVPGSQKVHIRGIPPTFNKPQDKAQWGDAGGPADLPMQQVFDDLPKGTAIIVHSGFIHARRAKPGMVDPRYFADISYCQQGTTSGHMVLTRCIARFAASCHGPRPRWAIQPRVVRFVSLRA